MNIIILALNNIKKSKSTAITLVILIMMATAFLYIGSSVILNLDSFYDDKVSRLDDANLSVIVNDDDVYNESYYLIKNNPHTEFIEEEEVLSFNPVNFSSGKQDTAIQFVLADADNERTLSKIKLIEKSSESKENAIILSYTLKVGYGYKIGDQIVLKTENKNLTYTVYGFFEDTLYSNIADKMLTKAYLFHNDYEKLKSSVSEGSKHKLINAKIDSIENSYEVRKECINKLSEEFANKKYDIVIADSKNAKNSINGFVSILMSLLIGFSLILVIIALVVIGFSIATYISDHIKNIGVLQAIGYVNKQIINISLVQFMLISIVGIMLGLMSAFIATPVVSNIVSSCVGLKWPVQINSSATMLSVITVLFLVFIITHLSAKKIKKITPITALKSGIITHNFKRNYVKLDGYKGSLNFAVSLKAIFHYLRQNCMIAVIVSVLTYVSIFSSIIYNNFVVDNTFLINTIGFEKVDVILQVNDGTSEKIYDEMVSSVSVDKVIKMWNKTILLNNETAQLWVYNDYSRLETKIVFDGRDPIHDNEIALSNSIAKSMKKKIGDPIIIKIDGISKDFLIVGISQHMTGYGRSVRMTEEGYKRYDSNFKMPLIGAYLKDSNHMNDFVKTLNRSYQNKDIDVTNYRDFISTVVKPFETPVILFVIIFTAITVTVVCLILLLLIKIRLIKERSHLGLSKALGYTTSQLIFQTVFSLVPVITVGVLIGTAGGCLLANPLMAFILSSMGIFNCNLTINYTYVGFVAMGIIAAAYIISNLAAYRIRKITPYELMDQ